MMAARLQQEAPKTSADYLRKYLETNTVSVPNPSLSIVSHECIICHDNDIHPNGLFVCTKTNLCFSLDCARAHRKLTGNSLYLKIRRSDECARVATKLAMNMNGGYHSEHPGRVFHERYSFELNFEREMQLSELSDIAEFAQLKEFAAAVKQSWSMRFHSWEEYTKVSSFCYMLNEKPLRVEASILDNAVCNDPECEVSGAGLLWFNLTSGFIGCAFNEANHSFLDFKSRMYPHPLVVRIDSLATEGDPEVYSYVEKGFVLVPNLKEYIRKIGITSFKRGNPIKRIDVDAMEANMMRSTYKPHQVITLDEFDQEDAAGSAFVGLRNPYTMCYMHASIQALVSVCDAFKSQFCQRDITISCALAHTVPNPATDLTIQTVKLVTSMMSPKVAGLSTPDGLHTTMFKDAMTSLGHPQFAPNVPGCAYQFLQYMMEKLPSFGQSFEFVLQKQNWQGNKLTPVGHFNVSSLSMDVLDLFLELRKQEDDIESPDVPLVSWLDDYFAWSPEECDGVTVKSRVRMVTFPDTLMLNPGPASEKLPNGEPSPFKLRTRLLVNEVLDMTPFKTTLPVESQALPKSRFLPEDQSKETVSALVKLRTLQPGISDEDGFVCLRRWANDVEMASDWYVQSREILATAQKSRATARRNDSPPQPDHTNCRYQLFAVIENRGNRLDEGHSVVYLRKPSIEPESASTCPPPLSSTAHWYLVNDELVTKLIRKLTTGQSVENVPPVPFGYIYFYKKIFV